MLIIRDGLRRQPKPTAATDYDVEEETFWRFRYIPVGSVIAYSTEKAALVPAGKIGVLVTKFNSTAQGMWLEVWCEAEDFRKKFKSFFKGGRKFHHICHLQDSGRCPLEDDAGVHLRRFTWFPPGGFGPCWLSKAGEKIVQSGVGLHQQLEKEREQGGMTEGSRGPSKTELRLGHLRARAAPHVPFARKGESRSYTPPEGDLSGTPRAGALRKAGPSSSALVLKRKHLTRVKEEVTVLDSESEGVKQVKKRKKKKLVIGCFIVRQLKTEHQLLLKDLCMNSQRVLRGDDLEGRSPLRRDEVGYFSLTLFVEFVAATPLTSFMEVYVPSAQTEIHCDTYSDF